MRAVLWPGQADDGGPGFASLPQVKRLPNVNAGTAAQLLIGAGHYRAAADLTLLSLASQTTGTR